jgi:hypothetical protein
LAESKLVELMCQFYMSAALDVGGGTEIEMFQDIVKETQPRAMALITFFITTLKELPEGGVIAPDVWKKTMEIVDGE